MHIKKLKNLSQKLNLKYFKNIFKKCWQRITDVLKLNSFTAMNEKKKYIEK